MPTYDYLCNKCDATIEVYQSLTEEPLKRHSGGCGGKLTKVLAPVGVVLKGSGFYKTDSNDSARSKSKARSSATSPTSKSDGGDGSKNNSEKSSSDSSSADTKTDSSSKKKSSPAAKA